MFSLGHEPAYEINPLLDTSLVQMYFNNRRSSEVATAKVKLSGHSLELEKEVNLTLKLVKKNRITIYLKVS